MAERAVPRVTRLLGIVSFLEANGETDFAILAEQFDVSVEQIRKDIATLWVSGLPGYMPHELLDFDADLFDQGIASLIEGHGVSQVRLSAREAVALLAALASFEATGAAPQVVASAIDKIKKAAGDADVASVAASQLDESVVRALHEGIARGVVVKVDYVNARDHRSVRDVEPHRLVSISGTAYLECFCQLAQDWRTLRVDRMSSVTVSNEPISSAPADKSGFALEPSYEATVVAHRRARRLFEELGAAVEVSGEVLTARFGVANEQYVAGQLLTVAPHIVSIEPQPLKDALLAASQSVIAALN